METSEKTVVVGDLHCKEELVLPRVDAAVTELGAGRVVFCGDYVDEWLSNALTVRDSLDRLGRWVRERRARGLGVDLVLGNHDVQYLLRESGPGTHAALYDEVAEALLGLGVRAAVTVGPWLVTHAGVTRAWANDCLDLPEGANAGEVAGQLNALLDHGVKISLRMLATAGPGRCGYELPGPLWADQSELVCDALPGLDQIVGHTPVRSIDLRKLPVEDDAGAACRLAFCDTMSLRRDLTPVGDGSMLLVEGRSARAVSSEELGLKPWGPAVFAWAKAYVRPFLDGAPR